MSLFTHLLFCSSQIQLIVDIASSGLHLPQKKQKPVFWSNPDFVFSGAHPQPRLAQGALRTCVSAVYKQQTGDDFQYTLFGKPTLATYMYASERLLEIARNLVHCHMLRHVVIAMLVRPDLFFFCPYCRVMIRFPLAMA